MGDRNSHESDLWCYEGGSALRLQSYENVVASLADDVIDTLFQLGYDPPFGRFDLETVTGDLLLSSLLPDVVARARAALTDAGFYTDTDDQ